MKKHMLRVLSMAIALTMSMTFALSGCGSDTGSSTSGEGTTSSTEESTGTEEGASTEETGDTETAQTTDYSDVVINYGLTTAWDSLNPYGSSSGSTFQHLVLDKLYDRLAYITEAPSIWIRMQNSTTAPRSPQTTGSSPPTSSPIQTLISV